MAMKGAIVGKHGLEKGLQEKMSMMSPSTTTYDKNKSTTTRRGPGFGLTLDMAHVT